jgi:pimeloyl-ACP methyl ester carboxylesterase
MAFFMLDGGGVHYERDGTPDGPAVLLWHGANCTLRMWDHVVERLRSSFDLIRFDVRGVGRSAPAANASTQYRLEQYAADANSILDACGVDRCHVWSMAWGSRAALAYCALNPSRVRTAALFDLSIGVADVPAQIAKAREARTKQRAAGLELPAAPEGWNRHEHPDEVPKALTAARRFDLLAAVPKLDMPVLVATGDHDPNLASSREFVRIAPNASLVVMPDVGHGSVLQRPDLTTDIFLEFVTQHVE